MIKSILNCKTFSFCRILIFLLIPYFFQTNILYAYEEKMSTPSVLENNFPTLKNSLLKNDWDSLKKELSKILNSIISDAKPCSVESPLRFLYGHSALATGESTKAVESFYCSEDIKDSQSIRDWLNWTQKLVSDNESSKWTTSHYLYGDALARSGQLNAAKASFDKALEIDKNNFLALNARGVVNWIIFETKQNTDENSTDDLSAIDDFVKVSTLNPDFADAYANLGITNLREQTSLDIANQMFDMATKKDSTFWLAENGKAVVAGAKGDIGQYKYITKKIKNIAPNTPYIDINTQETIQQKSDKGWGAHKFHAGVEFSLDPMSFKAPKLALNYEFNRGGIYMYLKDGENLVISKEDQSPLFVGTWFTLNYPLQKKGNTSDE